MALSFQDWLPDLWSNVAQFGAKQSQPLQNFDSNPVQCSTFLGPKPKGYESLSLSVVKKHLAVVPTDWNSGGIAEPWFAIESHNTMTECMNELGQAAFISFHDDFLNFIGRNAKFEMIHKFSGTDADHVHEAPVNLPDTNELLFADTSVVGWLWALNIDTHKIRKINTNPPLENVNGATWHNNRVYLTTNGGRAPGIYSCTTPKAPAKGDSATDVRETIQCEPVVNNYRLKHFNSPNDLIFTSAGNILFTDPTYGWLQAWPGVGPPELSNGIYHFNMESGATTALDNDQVLQPNGLILSTDEKTLYIAESNSTSSKPINVWKHSVRNVYAFDFDEASLVLKNRRLVHVVESGWPDGLRHSKMKDGRELVLVATMGGVDVVDVSRGGAGTLLGKVNVGNDIIFNLNRAPRTKQRKNDVWLMTGKKGVYKVDITLTD